MGNIILLTIIILIGIGIFVYSLIRDTDVTAISMLATLVIIGGIMGLVEATSDKTPNPTAIDVYNGKTTLQITYQDSIAIDTVVVWKDEFKPKEK